MTMYQSVSQSDFIDAFRAHDRQDQFSYDALCLLFDWMEEFEQDLGEPYELDVIAICCEFYESDEDEIRDNYSLDEDQDVEEYLNDNTMLVGITEAGGYVYQAF